MFQKSKSVLKILVACFLFAGVAACSWVKDDLDDCPTGVKVQFRVAMNVAYNGLFNAQAFYNDVEDVNLWVFDEHGVYLGTYTEQGSNLKNNDFTMELPLQAGRYKMVVWTGLQDGFYEVPALRAGVSKMEELTLRLKRDADNRQGEQLTPLWHGEIGDVEVRNMQNTLITVGLVKDTKTLVTVMQDVWGNDLHSEDYDFEIIAANGYMDHRNRLLDDDDIHYDAYFKQTAEVDTDNEFKSLTRAGEAGITKFRVARAELNTLRLMTDKKTRFVVTEKATGRTLMNINLTQYLLLTRTLYEGKYGVKISDKDYLDYEDTFSIIFFLTPGSEGSFLVTKLSINGWIIRLNDAAL